MIAGLPNLFAGALTRGAETAAEHHAGSPLNAIRHGMELDAWLVADLKSVAPPTAGQVAESAAERAKLGEALERMRQGPQDRYYAQPLARELAARGTAADARAYIAALKDVDKGGYSLALEDAVKVLSSKDGSATGANMALALKQGRASLAAGDDFNFRQALEDAGSLVRTPAQGIAAAEMAVAGLQKATGSTRATYKMLAQSMLRQAIGANPTIEQSVRIAMLERAAGVEAPLALRAQVVPLAGPLKLARIAKEAASIGDDNTVGAAFARREGKTFEESFALSKEISELYLAVNREVPLSRDGSTFARHPFNRLSGAVGSPAEGLAAAQFLVANGARHDAGIAVVNGAKNAPTAAEATRLAEAAIPLLGVKTGRFDRLLRNFSQPAENEAVIAAFAEAVRKANPVEKAAVYATANKAGFRSEVEAAAFYLQ